MTTNVNQTKIELVPTGIKFKMKIMAGNQYLGNLVRTGKPGDARFSYLILTPHVWGKGWRKIVEFQATPETQAHVWTNIQTWIARRFS